MASITINPLQQEQLIPFSFFRYHFSLNTPNFHYFPHPLTLLPLRTNHNRKFSQDFVVRARTSDPKFSTLQRQPSINTKNVRNRNETGHGYSSAKSIDKRVSENTEKNRVNSAVEEKSKSSRHTRKTPSHYRQSYQSSKGYTHTSGKPLEASIDSRVTEKIEKKNNENKAVKEKRVKSKKDRDSPEVKLRYDLDMCSKRGDVMGALSLYDTALREGIRLGQHHYTVLLYLCSSAAVGIVRPAKSGSGSRTSNTLAIANEVVNPLEFSGSTHKNDRGISNSDRTVLNSDDKNLTKFSSGSLMQNTRVLDNTTHSRKEDEKFSAVRDSTYDQEDHRILVSEDVKKYALKRGFEIYENMRKEEVLMNEAALTSVARIAMSMGDGDMAFEMVKQMKILGINPRLRSYDPALFTFCNNGYVDKAFAVEKDMLENGVFPEEPELAALLRVSIAAGNSDKVYYVLHKLRTIVREISTSTEDLIINWFKSKQASRVGKRKWDKRLIKEVMENNGGGWHGQGWLGKGQWEVFHTTVSSSGTCRCCGMRLATIDLDPIETEKFADSVASFAVMREKKSNFQKFQKWLDYYGPFEAVVDAANVGLFSQRRFKPSKINAVVNGIRQKLPSKKFPLIILHNRRISGQKMDEPFNKELIEKWKNSDALYATPTGSNDDWYWLYAAIKFKCLIVTNDEMRDHIFQLLGNDIFPKWKERHQVHFSFSDTGPEFHMPPPCSVVIQESEDGCWHIPIKSEDDFRSKRRWLCISRATSDKVLQECSTRSEDSQLLQDGECVSSAPTIASTKELQHINDGNQKQRREAPKNTYKNLRDIFSAVSSNHSSTILSDIEAAEFLDCDFFKAKSSKKGSKNRMSRD